MMLYQCDICGEKGIVENADFVHIGDIILCKRCCEKIAKNGVNDGVLEIIDKEMRYFESHYTCNEIFTYQDYIRHFVSVQRAVEALKGEQG